MMRIAYRLASSTLLLALGGCASQLTPVLQSRLAGAEPAAPVVCRECTTEWQRAQLWLAMHSKWRIQTATDVVLSTFSPTPHDPSYAFQVMRMPQVGGGYAISLSLVCGNMLGCDPAPGVVAQAFYHYVRTGTDVLVGMGYMGALR